ncbi:sigma-B regulation protein RsbU (phosphoserine phosphatase) [Algoriphagus boseongensis]|uniref:Sigma-B regulation protein RsbU (Phosphoserine phosphatase) n=1 Tax=Algoriphagus boseongensis TaxID=1442587 RepID=A0A4R6T4Y6_9BACT|nr:PP2C family protein-serine/threonine phosphatase [Algoriphagus boseongensis]TDQ15024.1 sigma-B regulation protein RsbU (phosphoserine phosphatase) [Algoriphagus boseongensis]
MAQETYKYQRKELELKALLEITQAINENQSESVLLNIFKFTCLVHLDIKSLILYVEREGVFEKKIAHGVKGKIPAELAKSKVHDQRETGELELELSDGYSFAELETYLPVYHKDKMLAILFLKRKSEEVELDLDFTQAIANILVVALENKRFARKQLQQEVFNREVAIASQVQQMLFPAELPDTQEMKAKVTYFPHSMVGGDYYDLIRKSKEKVYFCIADVSGKGIAAALLMSNFQATLRTLLRSDASLEVIVHQLNYTLFENTKGERFITFFLGEYDFAKKKLRYVNAGHNPPILCWEKSMKAELLEAGTTILGAFEELPFLEIGERKGLEKFTIHLYTDGLTEAMNSMDEEYGEDRFREFVGQHFCIDPEVFHEEFFKEMQAFSQKVPLKDDLTLLSIRFS